MEKKKVSVLAAAVLVVWLSACPADTYVLGDDQQWTSASDDPQAQYLLAVSKVKMAVAAGDSSDATDALEELKRLYPDMAGPDLDAFIEAELAFAKANWSAALKKYQQFMINYPDSVLYNAAMERVYSLAAGFLAGQRQTLLGFLKVPAWDKGAELMREVADKAGTAPLAHRALKTLAQAQEKKSLHMEAYQTWSEIADRWPTGELGMEALLSMAQNLHVAYQDPESDATVLRGAMSYYEDFADRYPATADQYEVRQTISLIREQMAYKQYHVGYYYERTDNEPAALLYYQAVLEEWPGTEAAEMAADRIAAQRTGEGLDLPNTASRRLFMLGNVVLDSWFGLDAFLDLPSPEEGDANEMDQIN